MTTLTPTATSPACVDDYAKHVTMAKAVFASDAAAYGDSNDTEIELLREAIDEVSAFAGHVHIDMPDDEDSNDAEISALREHLNDRISDLADDLRAPLENARELIRVDADEDAEDAEDAARAACEQFARGLNSVR